MNYLNLLLVLVNLLDVLLPDGGKGAQKLAMLKAFLAKLIPSFEQAWPLLEELVGEIVKAKKEAAALGK